MGAGNQNQISRFQRVAVDDASRVSLLPQPLPNDVQYIFSPAALKHWLVYEIFFSIHGEELKGSVMKTPGPGALRLAGRSKETVFPSVGDD